MGTALSLADRIDAALPQAQCGRCGHDGCRPYAESVAQGEAINRCPPGGDALIATLAALTGRPVVPLDPGYGKHESLAVARIDEAWCIGCTLCIKACPVDAIIGAPKAMHTVLSALCSGCALCLPPCPVDCIEMIPAGRAWSSEDGRAARERFDTRARRLVPAVQNAIPAATLDPDRARRQAAAAAALVRARARRAAARN